MYMTLRTMHAAPGKVFDLLEAVAGLLPILNSDHGASYAAGTQVGGDPDVVGISSPWATLGDYAAFRESAYADERILSTLRDVGPVVVKTEDQIAKVHAAPGERAPFSALARARMHMPRIAEAIPFGLEVSEFIEAKTGTKVGFATAVTGNQSEAAWFSRHDSLQAMAEVGEALAGDPEYLDLFKRADGLYVDGSLEQTIWQFDA